MTGAMGRWADKHIIMLNGPKRVGKDVAAETLRRYLPNAVVFHMAADMERGMVSLFDIPYELERQVKLPGSVMKEQPLPELMGLSWRQMLIKLSEECYKPVFGQEFFGHLMLRKILKSPAQYIILNSIGFIYEIKPILLSVAQSFDPRQRVKLIRVHREGHTFDGDSRSWIDDSSLIDVSKGGQVRKRVSDYVESYDLHNKHDLEMYHMQVRRAANLLLGIQGNIE
jgi:hypothetical protein